MQRGKGLETPAKRTYTLGRFQRRREIPRHYKYILMTLLYWGLVHGETEDRDCGVFASVVHQMHGLSPEPTTPG